MSKYFFFFFFVFCFFCPSENEYTLKEKTIPPPPPPRYKSKLDQKINLLFNFFFFSLFFSFCTQVEVTMVTSSQEYIISLEKANANNITKYINICM